MELGVLVKTKRQQKGITQRELSEKLGYSSPQYISNFERGICGLSPKKFKTVSKMLGIPAKQLVEISAQEYAKRISKEAGVRWKR